jgi:hypothetical protein
MAMLMAVAAIGLSGFRDMTGTSSNDSQDQAPNSKNLAQGSKEPYPNLASVPKVPDNAITKADREKLAQSLIADRQNAQYTDEQLRAGQNMTAVAPPPEQKAAPAVKVTVPAAEPKVSGVAKPAPVPAVAAAPVKQETLPPVTPAPKMAAAAPVAPAPTAGQTAAAPPAEKKKADKAKKKKEAGVKRGAEKVPEESSLHAPTLGAMPEGEAARNPPPPRNTRQAKSRPAPRSEEIATAEPSRSDAETAKPRGNVTVQAVEIGFSPGPFRARILPADRHELVEIAKMVAHNNGRVRIVGYGGAPARGDREQREFQSFNAALDNAKAVGVELAKLGVPASRIDIETKANVNSADKAEVFVEY